MKKRGRTVVPALLLTAAVLLVGCRDDDNAPGSHTEDLGGVRHASGFSEPRLNCIACHGMDLDGGEAPGCFSCHSQGAF